MRSLMMHALNRCPGLDNPRGSLDETKDHSEYQNKCGNPKSIPLDPLSVIVPPLRDGSRLRIIESLFENDQAISPILEVVDLAALGV
jgi:hypothetical protein